MTIVLIVIICGIDICMYIFIVLLGATCCKRLKPIVYLSGGWWFNFHNKCLDYETTYIVKNLEVIEI